MLDREQRGEPLYEGEIFGLSRPRDVLYDRINRRVDIMMEQGLLEEVKTLLSMGISPKATSMQAIGYKELVWYLDGTLTLKEAVDKIKQESRRYAKSCLLYTSRCV